ncbi:MAG: Gfo/Idh/MocA family protein [Chitinophagaceae bacterium]
MSRKINFAIIGCGRIAHRHAEEIKKIGELIAVCDVDEAAGKAFAQTYQTKFYTCYEKLLETETLIDVIAVCTPNGLHAKHTIQALNKNYHVLCEKPMAIHSSDAKKMIEASEQNKKHLFIVKQNRFNTAVAAVKKALQINALGKIYSFQLSCFWNRNADYYKNNWHGKKQMDGGTLFTQFSHFIDILQWYLGNVENVHSFFANQAHKNIIEFEDTGVVILQLSDNILGTLNYTVNSYRENMEGSLTIFGEKGTVKIGGQYLNTIQYHCIDNYTISLQENDDKTANDYGFYKGSMSNHDKVYANVVDVINNGASITANAYDGLKTVEIIEKIYAAADRNF